MSEIILSLIITAVHAAVKVITETFTKHVMSRKKERTAPVSNKDGSTTK